GDQNFTQWHPNHPDAVVLYSKSTHEQQINSLDLNEFARTFNDWVKTISTLHSKPQTEPEPIAENKSCEQPAT
ncbi:MAG: hypothetical protein ACRC9T_06710, partial [Vibrionaceae bacterium]